MRCWITFGEKSYLSLLPSDYTQLHVHTLNSNRDNDIAAHWKPKKTQHQAKTTRGVTQLAFFTINCSTVEYETQHLD